MERLAVKDLEAARNLSPNNRQIIVAYQRLKAEKTVLVARRARLEKNRQRQVADSGELRRRNARSRRVTRPDRRRSETKALPDARRGIPRRTTRA